MRGWIYDISFTRLTRSWYREVLERLPEGAHLLDVGIGTGRALAGNAALVRERGVRVTGIDIDADYIKRSRKILDEADLAEQVQVLRESVYDHQGGPYDAVYFSASFMLLPDPVAALKHVSTLLSEDGQVFFTQTFQDKRSALAEKVKPLLKKVTTIDFGEVTYEEDFRNTVAEAGLELLELEVLKESGDRSYRLAVGAP
ncbi:MAG: class I SAM-dependent methyltransferase [Alphaproteobacteria bacterium]|nr:class I SAM-dependent methyltransferase [Alphaproteobacteria bacterium]